MKRAGVLILALMAVSLIFAGCAGKKDGTGDKDRAERSETGQSSEAQTQETTAETTKARIANEKPVYLYYMNYSDDMAERISEYECEWTDEEDLATFAAIALDSSSFDFIEEYGSEIDMQKEIWDSVSTSEKYHIGYEVSFDINGDHKIYTILEPSDVENEKDLFMGDWDDDEITGYLGIWLYDDYHQDGGFYDHVDPDEYDDDTLLTSIKLRLTPDGLDISNLKLKAFSYSDSLEFDRDGHYNNEYGCEISIIGD